MLHGVLSVPRFNLAHILNITTESTEMVNNIQLLMKIAKRAGQRAILKHRLAGVSVSGSIPSASLIVSHKIDYQAITPKAKYRESIGLLAKVNEKHNQKTLKDLVSLINNGMTVQSRSRGYQLTHTITAKAL